MSCRCGARWTGTRIEHCPACHETFTGTTAGDKHRTGDHATSTGPNRRRCLTADEMLAKGMARNSRNQWMTTARDLILDPRVFPQIDAQDNPGGLGHPSKTNASKSVSAIENEDRMRA